MLVQLKPLILLYSCSCHVYLRTGLLIVGRIVEQILCLLKKQTVDCFKDCIINLLFPLQALLKKVNVGEGGLISYDDFLNSFQKSDAEVRITVTAFTMNFQFQSIVTAK